MNDTIIKPVVIKALTIKQPWAWLMAEGLKDVENRSWQTHYRGFLAIHVGKSNSDLSPQVLSRVDEILSESNFNGARLPSLEVLKEEQGKAIAIANLFDVNKDSKSPFAIEPEYQWHLRNIKRIDPIPRKGKLGLWNFNSSNITYIDFGTEPELIAFHQSGAES